MARSKNKGLVHIYMGKGKGKTTASIGLCVRARGAGMRVMLVQFLKGRETAEIASLEKIGVKIIRDNKITKFLPHMNQQERLQCAVNQRALLETAERAALSGGVDLIVLDEVLDAIECGLIGPERVVELVKNKASHVEMVLTGRTAQKELIDLSDYVSQINVIKHPYNAGVTARKGIEY